MIEQTIPVSSLAFESDGTPQVGIQCFGRGTLPVSVPLAVESYVSGVAGQPVTIGIPWQPGALVEDRVISLVDSSGQAVALQTKALAHWPDESVKWLLLDFVVNRVSTGGSVWNLRSDDERSSAPAPAQEALFVERTARDLVVHTGSASFTVDRKILAPICRAELDRRPLLDSTRTQTVLTDLRDQRRRPLIERCEIEATGPVRATVRLVGTFEGQRRGLRFVARLSFFAGSSLVRVELTLHNPRRARHRGGLWDLGDPGSTLFRDLSLRLGLIGHGDPEVRWIEDFGGDPQVTAAAPFEIYQDSSGGENWSSRNHVNRYGRVPCRFRGYRVRRGDDVSGGYRASSVVAVRGPAGTITAAIPEFWQQFPKAIDTEGGTLNLRLFPGQFGDAFELQGGERKTHTVWLHFGRDDAPDLEALRWVHRPACVHCPPEWYAEAGVIPHLLPGRPDLEDRYESLISAVVAGPRSLSARREVIDEYGWRNYGEIYADHEGAYYTGDPPVISHYNNQYDMTQGLLVHYIRTGDARWMGLADPLARHVMDIDIYHTREDRAAYNGGMFWHTDHYRDAATSTHRAYSRANCGSNSAPTAEVHAMNTIIRPGWCITIT